MASVETTQAMSPFSGLKSSLFSSINQVSTAASAAANAAASIKLSSSLGYGSRKEEIKIPEEISIAIQELGLNNQYADEKIEIFDKFNSICEADGNSVVMEKFIMDMKARGHNVQWADAAFRCFDEGKKCSLSKQEYLLAIFTLRADEELTNNSKWLELRRKLVFTYYDRGGKGHMTSDDFCEFAADCELSQDIPETFGIHNKKWQSQCEENSTASSVSYQHMSQSLAISKVELATKQSEFEELQFSYLQLEKKMCSLKLELAAARAMNDR